MPEYFGTPIPSTQATDAEVTAAIAAVTDSDFLVGTATGDLSAEIVVGTAPGGELGGTWASPTVDATHSGTRHAARDQAFKPTAATYEAFSRDHVNGIRTVASGYLHMVGIWLPAGATVSNISFVSATTAMVAGTNQWFALFDGSRVKRAISADDTSTAWGANALKTLAMTTPYVIPTDGLYYIGYCVAAATPPTFECATDGGGVLAARSLAPILYGRADSGLTNPASCPSTAATLDVFSNSQQYGYVS